MRITHLSLAGLRGRLDRTAVWVRLADDGSKPARPPRDVVGDMEALPRTLPTLRGLIGTPTFSPDGTLVTAGGCQASTRLYYEPSGEPVPRVPQRPDATDLKRAKQIIGQEWLADFPFVDEASRAHAIAIPVAAIARELIDGPTPLFAIDAPAADTGKGLLANGIGIIVTGELPPVMTEARSEEELRKRVTALLLTGGPVVLFDNLRRRQESGTLAALLTATVWSDRLLGKTQMVELPNRALWVATGNNRAPGSLRQITRLGLFVSSLALPRLRGAATCPLAPPSSSSPTSSTPPPSPSASATPPSATKRASWTARCEASSASTAARPSKASCSATGSSPSSPPPARRSKPPSPAGALGHPPECPYIWGYTRGMSAASETQTGGTTSTAAR